MEKDVLKREVSLPVGFDGTFRFTNWTDEEFVGVWGGKEYVFPPRSTSPMIIPDQTPLEIQHIRKKFAKNLAEREFFKTESYKKMLSQERNPDGSARANSIFGAGTYSDSDITTMVQRCLEPMDISQVSVRESVKQPLEEKLSRNEDGELNTEVVDSKRSLIEKARSK